ncbi:MULTISPECIES: histidine phosphatase family protein [Aphanothece]|uniref:histidine phosphatase family protein n=1 Tax=Aphanothece TaxID=1121 RepID=UPI003984FE12
MALRIVLVRHGLSSFNVEHRIQGRDDLSELTAEGERQALAAGEALADVPFSGVYSSPLRRAADTARLMLQTHGQGLEASLDDDLMEIDLAPWSGLLRRELRERFPEQEQRWREAPQELVLERADGSSYRPLPELMVQADRFCRRLIERHGAALGEDGPGGDPASVLVVAHNAILRCLVLSLLGLEASGFRRLRIDNGSISVLNLRAGERQRPDVQLESLNSSAHLGDPLPPKGACPRLLLVRHGETDWNRQGRFQGQIDIPLNANGHAQAEAAGAFLASVAIQRAYTSAMARPRQTAEAILASHPGVPLTSTTGLVEIGHGLWEGRLEGEIAEGWSQLLADWKRAPETVQMPQGETIHDVWQRSLSTWQRIAASLSADETALVVAHDAVNKTILCALLGLTPADIWMIKQGNGGVTVVDYPNGPAGTPVVAAMNLTAHLGGVLDRTAAGAL